MTLLSRDFQRRRSVQHALIYTAAVVDYAPNGQVNATPAQLLPHSKQNPTPNNVSVPLTTVADPLPLLPLSGLSENLPPLLPLVPVKTTQQAKQTAWHRLSQSLQHQPFTALRSMAHDNSPPASIHVPFGKARETQTGRAEGLQDLYTNRPMVLADDL